MVVELNSSRIWKTTDGWNYDFEIRHAIYSRYGSANMFWCDMQNLSDKKHC